jgi:hypothetical protein
MGIVNEDFDHDGVVSADYLAPPEIASTHKLALLLKNPLRLHRLKGDVSVDDPEAPTPLRYQTHGWKRITWQPPLYQDSALLFS